MEACIETKTRCQCALACRIPVLRFAEDYEPPESAGDERADPHFSKEAVMRLTARARRDPATGCLLWQGGRYGKSEYGAVGFRGTRYRAHRLAWMAHKGPIADGLLVCHRCDNPRCIAIEHLFLGTPKDNMTDMRRKGRARWRTKLDAARVVEMRARLRAGETIASVARGSGVRYQTVYAIAKGRIWKDVP